MKHTIMDYLKLSTTLAAGEDENGGVVVTQKMKPPYSQ